MMNEMKHMCIKISIKFLLDDGKHIYEDFFYNIDENRLYGPKGIMTIEEQRNLDEGDNAYSFCVFNNECYIDINKMLVAIKDPEKRIKIESVQSDILKKIQELHGIPQNT